VRACACVYVGKMDKNNRNYFIAFPNIKVFLCSPSLLLFFFSTYYPNFSFYTQFNIVTFLYYRIMEWHFFLSSSSSSSSSSSRQRQRQQERSVLPLFV